MTVGPGCQQLADTPGGQTGARGNEEPAAMDWGQPGQGSPGQGELCGQGGRGPGASPGRGVPAG